MDKEPDGTEEVITSYDGYNIPFPPEVQQRHREYVLESLRQHEEWIASQRIEYVEPEWKDKPAGWQSEKGTGV